LGAIHGNLESDHQRSRASSTTLGPLDTPKSVVQAVRHHFGTVGRSFHIEHQGIWHWVPSYFCVLGSLSKILIFDSLIIGWSCNLIICPRRMSLHFNCWDLWLEKWFSLFWYCCNLNRDWNLIACPKHMSLHFNCWDLWLEKWFSLLWYCCNLNINSFYNSFSLL